MINLELFFKEQAVPEWFKKHPVCKEIKEVNKIFPTIGLSNFTVESNLENNNSATLIRNLCAGIGSYLNSAKYYLGQPNPLMYYPNLKRLKADKFRAAVRLISQFHAQVLSPQPFINQFPTKKGLYIQKDILDEDKKVFAKQNESLFKAYRKLSEHLQKNYNYVLSSLEHLHAFKEYSSNNFDGKLNIVFSSDGVDGAWDILTMSMRGISSCQTWTGQYAKCTIGSVLDPFTGIIYLTSGSKTAYGSKMMRRCIVRFVVDSHVKRPCLFLEYMYPGEHPATMKAFKDAIRSKVGDRFPIITQHNPSSNQYYVPYSETTKLLVKHSNKQYVNMRGNHNTGGILPYRDTFMEYRIKDDGELDQSVLNHAKTKQLGRIQTKLEGTTNIADHYITVIKDTVGSAMFETTGIYKDIATYTRDAYMKLLLSKSKISKDLVAKIKATMKANKHKSILITGATTLCATKEDKKSAKTTSKSAKVVAKAKKTTKATKAAKPVKAAKVIKPKLEETASTIEGVVEKHVLPIISEVCKQSFQDAIAKKAIKAKPKNK